MRTTIPLAALLMTTALITTALMTTACSGTAAQPNGTSLAGQTVDVVGTWGGDEQKGFEEVLKAFKDKTGAEVRYTPAGDELPTVLQTRIQGGTPPSVALVAQPGLVAQLAQAGSLKPLGPEVQQAVSEHNAAIWKRLGSVNGTLYGVLFKAANKSIVWYSEPAFTQVGAKPPVTWDDLLTVGRTITDTGQAAVAIGGGDGWTLTDWFENVYIRVAGVENYDKLSRHEIPWTDPSVRQSLEVLAQLFSDDRLVAGGRTGALQTDYPKSVITVFGEPSKAAMVFAGDFAANVITVNTKAKIGEHAKVTRFPSIRGSKDALVAAGDMAVQLKDDPASKEFMKFLASPEAGRVWAQRGGFLSPNKGIPRDAYPDEVTRELTKQIIDAGENVRFDMSDLAPTAFGGTKGAGEWQALQGFLADPTAIDATMRRLETEAAKAFGK